ncbi:InlB B-repeat-containing protein [Microbacterium halophytorum]|uniref:InlB B-repeat-containing protein n=1 Tax=Microbacterium halophytorum TaxID=2067568 RepID=UPI0018E07311|nr:InlB B-repeat-containing protein [Microbacterium halophytorum]
MRDRTSFRRAIALGISLATGLSLFGLALPAAAGTGPTGAIARQIAPAATDEDAGEVVVTFDTGGGGEVEAQRLSPGAAIAEPDRPTKDGAVFVGWYADAAASSAMWDFRNGTVTEPLTLYAKWVQVDETHLLLNAYASEEELESPYVASTLQALGELSDDERLLTVPDGTTVYVAPGVYWTDRTYREGGVIAGPNVGLSILGEDVSFLGLTDDATDTIIAGNRGEGGESGLGADGSWYSLGISSGFRGENITIANYAQQDLVYPRDPSQNIEKRLDSKNHAEVLTRAVGTGAPDRIHFENMRFVGYLNMMLGLAPERAYFKDSFFQLTDDSVFSGKKNVYENCTFHFFGNHPSVNGADDGGIVALLGSEVVGMPQMTSSDVFLAKQSNEIGPDANGIFAIIDTHFSGRIETVEWENVVREDARHFVSNNTIGDERAPLAISPAQPQTSVELTGSALEAFKVGDEYNVYNLLKGDDGWDPKGQAGGGWEPFADLPYRFLVGAEGKTMRSGETGESNRAVLTPAVAPAGSADPAAIEWEYDTELLDGTIDPETGVGTFTAAPNATGAEISTIVTATLPSGISAGATLHIRPLPVDPPVVTDTSLTIGENAASLDYALDEADYREASVIDWYRESGPDTTDGVHIGTMRNDDAGFFIDEPYTEYALGRYDVGSYLRAVIRPKYEFSGYGDPVTVRSERPVEAADVTEASLSTDFRNLFVTDEDHLTTTGRWFFDRVSGTAVPWGWGIGTNGTDRIWGLQNNSGGAGTRFVFGQEGAYGDMSLTLDYSTSKVEGQGFGGSGHFMDVYVKYDPAARVGYGLRVERTAAGGSNATMWTLNRYDGDTVTPVTEPIRTAAFMPKSEITIGVEGDTLRVRATTESERTPLQVEQGLSNSVDLAWTDTTGALRGNDDAGFGFRINNSGNSSYDYAGSGMMTNNTVMLHGVTVTAEEAARESTVTFDTRGGSDVAPVTVEAGAAVGEPAAPTRGEDLFFAWATDPSCEAMYDFGSAVTGDLTLYACWEMLVAAEPSARVDKVAGPENALTITVTEEYSRGTSREHVEAFTIRNNASGVFEVAGYRVHVATYDNTGVRDVRLVG